MRWHRAALGLVLATSGSPALVLWRARVRVAA